MVKKERLKRQAHDSPNSICLVFPGKGKWNHKWRSSHRALEGVLFFIYDMLWHDFRKARAFIKYRCPLTSFPFAHGTFRRMFVCRCVIGTPVCFVIQRSQTETNHPGGPLMLRQTRMPMVNCMARDVLDTSCGEIHVAREWNPPYR